MVSFLTYLSVCFTLSHSNDHQLVGMQLCALLIIVTGQQKGERYQTHLRQVSQLFHKEASIVLVACSDAAIACLTSRGDIFLLHDYTCRKIASR